jgi:DNA-binding NarL/FixJ family response regulator
MGCLVMARKLHSPAPKRRVFLVDDEPLVRRGLRILLSMEPDLEVCGEAETEQAAVEGILAQRPDLAIVDLSLKEGDGLALIKRLRQLCPALKTLVFSMHDQLHFATAAFAAGAQGYVVKEEGTDQVREAVQVVLDEGYYLSELLAAKAPRHRPSTGPRYAKRPL